MPIHLDQSQEKESPSLANQSSTESSTNEHTFQLADNRPEAIAQRKLQAVMHNSAQVKQLHAFQEMANNSPQVKQLKAIQNQGNSNDAQVIQRVVINLDPGDKAITESARLHQKREGKDAKLITGDIPKEKALPLSEIGKSEEITVLAHGTPAMGGDEPRVAGMTPAELFAHLVKMGLTPKHTGMINLSNCTSAWDRKSTGSFLDHFVKILKQHGFHNYVTGYESFTESVNEKTELEVPHDKREVFLAHKITERYLMELMNLNPADAIKDKGAVLKHIHSKLKGGVRFAYHEASDFLEKKDKESQGLGHFYMSLGELLNQYLSTAEDKYNEKAILHFQMEAMGLMKIYNIDHMGARLHGQKVEAIPVLSGGAMAK